MFSEGSRGSEVLFRRNPARGGAQTLYAYTNQKEQHRPTGGEDCCNIASDEETAG